MAIKIFIDQGHNPEGINAGAEGFGLREQDITYDVGIYLRDILNRDPRFEALPRAHLGAYGVSHRRRVSLHRGHDLVRRGRRLQLPQHAGGGQ